MSANIYEPKERRRKLKAINEIEVTPEMITAGVEALSDFDDRFDSRKDAVVRIFKAMMAAAAY